MNRDKRGRGHLSSIDLLPEEAEEDIVWALEQLRDNSLPQTAILEEFNLRLSDKGIEPISKSAFGRYSIRKARQFRQLDAVRRMSSELVETLGPEGPDEVTVMVAEMIKTAAYQALEGGELSTKEIMELSRSLQSAVGAQAKSDDYRKQLERRAAEQVEAAADRAEKVVREAGLSGEAIAQMRREFLGVKDRGAV